MIQCETRLASVLWRFQIKSTLHNSPFTMEFFSNFSKKKTNSKAHARHLEKRIPMGSPRRHLCPTHSPICLYHWSNFLLPSWFPRSQESAASTQDRGAVRGVERDLRLRLRLPATMTLEIGAKHKASPCSRGTRRSRLYKVVRELTHPSQGFHLGSLHNLRSGAQLQLLISFVNGLVHF